MVLNVHRNRTAYWGRGEGEERGMEVGEREIIYLSLHCHHQNDSCIKVGSDESHFNVSVGSDGQSHRTVSTNHNLRLMIACIALFSALLTRLTALALWFCMSDWLFVARFFVCLFLNIHRSAVLSALAWLVPHETAAVSARILCTPYNHAPSHFMQNRIRKVYVCLAVTCHLHFWQTDLDLLRATAVTRGWNGYRNKSQHRKSTLEKKILPPLLQGFEPATFQSRVWRSDH